MACLKLCQYVEGTSLGTHKYYSLLLTTYFIFVIDIISPFWYLITFTIFNEIRSIKKQYQKMVKVVSSYAVVSVGVNISVTNISKVGHIII
jgi:uncharacterized protein YerC